MSSNIIISVYPGPCNQKPGTLTVAMQLSWEGGGGQIHQMFGLCGGGGPFLRGRDKFNGRSHCSLLWIQPPTGTLLC